MKVAFLTSGGVAPCLSASIAYLIKEYSAIDNSIEFYAYKHGYKGLLLGNKISIPNNLSNKTDAIASFGGSAIGNSRVKLTNINDCIKNKYIKQNELPVEVAAKQLASDQINILHTIGGDDTNTAASDLVKYLKTNNYDLTVVGLPKTIDNDVFPISQTLGASTASEQGAIFFNNIVNENTTSSRQLIIHEIMGRNCGWLTAATAYEYRKLLKEKEFVSELMIDEKRWDIHGIYLPEKEIDFNKECIRLNAIMDKYDCVNIFLSEGAGLDTIINEMKSNNESIKYDAFGHVRLDEINPGQWFAKNFKDKLNADKVLVQKSGYFSRSAAPNKKDIELIKKTVKLAVKSALNSNSGVVAMDEDNKNLISCIDFNRIKGGKPFNINTDWFIKILNEIGQK
ncbi:MAG: pyrophosphate--fructose-6-phosphate 1-phosphotransferase [Gammaproteobacteria bacterium]|nr:pyrophosphate--fructose-6-phosphate 1-phosphotransferase [Gammaproteobacteria bacterium]